MLNTELRPLGAGEILDRAVTLFVRRFALIVTVLAVVSVPVVLAQALAAPQSGRIFTDLAQVFTATDPAATRKATDAITADSGTTPLVALVTFGAIVVRLLMWTAILAVVSAVYAGEEASVGAAYRLALRRWFPQMVVALAFMMLGGVAFIPVMIVYVLLLFGIVALSALHATALAIAFGIAGGLVVLAAALVLFALVYMAYELAAVALVTETGNPVAAVGIALRRAFAPGMKRRTLVAGIVLVLVMYAGTLPIVALAAVATMLTHVDVLYFVVLGVGTVLLEGIVAAFTVVYAVDVRVRREGLDLVVPQGPLVPA